MRFGGLIAAIVLAAIAAIVVLRMTDKPAPVPVTAAAPAKEANKVNIYVAAVPIPIGSTITQEMLAIQPWPEPLMLPGFISADAASQTIADKAVGGAAPAGAQNIIGTVARSPFQQQEPIIESKLANPKDPNFLAAGLPKGMRIITIQTNETEGLAGFIFPGDHVDVILTHDVKQPYSEPTSSNGITTVTAGVRDEPISETLLNNVTVLAVDQHASGAGATDKDGKLLIPRSVSLQVSQVDAQRIRLGQKVGTLTLSLRSLADRDAADPATLVKANDISQYKTGAIETPTATSGGSGSGQVTIYRGAPKDNSGASGPTSPSTPASAGAK